MTIPSAPVEVFRTHSSVEAEVVRGLLDAHDIETSVGAPISRSLFPVRFGQTEFVILVPKEHAARAKELITGHLDEAAASEVRRISETLGPLEARIGYRFRDLGLLEHALTHRSRAHEDASGGVIDNESLEFLGDAVLGFVIADLLFGKFPTHSEGYKSKVKAGIVSSAALARLADDIGLGQYVLLGRGEEKTGGRQKQAILADGFEALIAAVYLDGGIDPAASSSSRYSDRSSPRRATAPPMRASRRTGSPPSRNGRRPTVAACRITGWPRSRAPIIASGSTSKCWSVGKSWRRASGRSKKEAEQQAAKAALNRFR
jgi:ribonuclease-3